VTPEDLLAEADRCVKCGLCLTECPTYRLLVSEADSPRGRISLIQALARGELDLDSHLEIHLDRCLSCRACESACPSGVRYGMLLDACRETITKSHGGRPLIKRLLNRLTDTEQLSFWNRIYQGLRYTGLIKLAYQLPIPRLQRLLTVAEMLPPAPVKRTGLYPASQPNGQRLQLFTGCVGSQVEDNLVQASIQLLSKLGYAVDIPVESSCCGALHRHNGFTKEADQLSHTIREQTRKSKAQQLITISTACHLELFEQQVSELPLFSITDFLLQLPPKAFSPLKPLHKKAVLHIPCSARHDHSRELLMNIPGLQLYDLPENNLCCGAAGTYMLTQPELSLRLGKAKLAHLKGSQADLLLTSNTGCAMQFRQLIKEAGLFIEVMHPVELIHNQWNNIVKKQSNRVE
jgi:glycolate oxidase iron-sulfur subunit